MKTKSFVAIAIYSVSLALLLVAFLLRLDFLLARIFHIDEYISMLSAQMTALKGAPILPSGMLYHQGLLLSYLAAPFIRLTARFTEEMARWPSLLAGMLTVAGFYLAGRRLFFSQAAGLFALTFATLDTFMILWSGRMRMYALAALFMVLAIYFLTRGTLLNPRPVYRLAAAGCYLAAVLSHSVAVVVLPAWLLAVLIVVLIGRTRFRLAWYLERDFRRELVGFAILLLLGVGIGVSVIGQVAVLQPDNPGGSQGGVMGFLSQFIEPGVSWQRVDDYIYYFTSPAYRPLAALAGLAVLLALVAVARGSYTRRDLSTLLLALIFVLTLAELGLVLVSTWRKTRYLFIVCQPVFLLLAADGLARLGSLLAALFQTVRRITGLLNQESGVRSQESGVRAARVSKRPPYSPRSVPTPYSPLFALVGVALIVGLWSEPALDRLGSRGTGDYDTAFAWVKTHWQAGDQVMTVHPSAAYLYLGRSDYYLAERRARVLLDDEADELVDRYVGSQLIDSVEMLNQVFAGAMGRLWLVVDTDRLFSRYGTLFTQEIFAQMDIVHNAGGVPVFLSRPYPRPAPAEPRSAITANFNPLATTGDYRNLIALGGYSIDFNAVAPDGTVQLALYWRLKTAQIPKPFKVFVQLRNEQGQTIAQADHFIFEGLLTQTVLEQLVNQSDWLRDTADLKMPGDLPGGTYRLFVGLYDPDTFERVPLLGDGSGENAVILEGLTIP